jgi:GNAT superfamily N-acetyltransferase
MITFDHQPPIDSAKQGQAFIEVICMNDGTRRLGRAVWGLTAPGVVQLLEFEIEPAVRRSGHGRRLLTELIEQARQLHRLRRETLRRLWIGVGHKSQVVGRSFLTGQGFHHVGSTCGLLEDEDMLVYVKSLD